MSTGNRDDLLFGKIALNKGYITATLLQQALQHQSQVEPGRHLGEILLARGLITQQQVQIILQMQTQIAAARQAAAVAEQSGQHHAPPPQAPQPGVAPRPGLPPGQPATPGQLAAPDQWSSQGTAPPPQPESWTVPVGPSSGMHWTGQPAAQGVAPRPAPQPAGRVGGASSGAQRSEAVTLHGQGSPSASDSTDAEIDALLGQSLGGCLVDACIGRGGMGAIYRARHLALNKDVVLKVLPKKLAENPRTVERFLREAQAAARLEHPSIVAVHNVGSEAGLHYIVMQFVDGQDLAELILQKKRFAPEEACRIVLRVAEGLVVAHRNGIIHRDIKAENILVTQQGEVKIADFGLAKDLDSDVKLTSEGQIIGTPLYMAPEIGRVSQIDGRVDLYSLGVTFYFMVSGQQPFAAFNTLDVLSGRAHEQIKPLADLCPDLPHEVTDIVERLMKRDRDQRYGTAEELVDDLLTLVEGHSDGRRASSAGDSSGRVKSLGRKSSGRLAAVGIHRGQAPDRDSILGLPRPVAISLAIVVSLMLGIYLLITLTG